MVRFLCPFPLLPAFFTGKNGAALTPLYVRCSAAEIHVLSVLKHPNVIGYHESFIAQGKLSIVMDYADGGYPCPTTPPISVVLPAKWAHSMGARSYPLCADPNFLVVVVVVVVGVVVPLPSGGDLFQKIQRASGYFPEEQILDWFMQITIALRHVHSKNILHRDLKSQNIFLTRKNIVKLGDFGIAKVLCNKTDMAKTV